MVCYNEDISVQFESMEDESVMKKRIMYLGVAFVAAAIAVAARPAADLLNGHAQALNTAKSLQVEFSLMKLGGAPVSYKLSYAKPNMARIETPTQILVADGSKITVYDKAANTYYKKDQSAAAFKELIHDEPVLLWSGFFNKDIFAKASGIKANGEKNRKGMSLKVVDAILSTETGDATTLYIAPDAVARQAEFKNVKDKNVPVVILDTQSVTIGTADVDASTMAFKAPANSKEVEASAMMGFKWYDNFDAALKDAKETNRVVMVDFYTTWCHWCKVMDKEVFTKKEFQDMSKFFVFVKIDAEVEVGLAQKYKVSAYPTYKFINKGGDLIHEALGYQPIEKFLQEMETAKGKAGL